MLNGCSSKQVKTHYSRVFQKAYSEQPRSASHWSFLLTCWCPWPHPHTRSALRSPASYSRRITCRLNAASGSNLVWSLLLSQRILSGFVLNTCKKPSPIKIVTVSQGNIRRVSNTFQVTVSVSLPESKSRLKPSNIPAARVPSTLWQCTDETIHKYAH